jgi:predicted alternative tryptophan synthase beta-subunit
VTGNGSHLTTDACNRVWYINTSFGVRIYDSTGVEIGTWNMSLSSSDQIYDILLLSNYIVLISHYQKGKVVQYNPQVTCA